jgi:hypothetical protein
VRLVGSVGELLSRYEGVLEELSSELSSAHAANTDLARRLARHEPLHAHAGGGAAAAAAASAQQQQQQQQQRPPDEQQPRASHYEQPQQAQQQAQQQAVGYQVVAGSGSAFNGGAPHAALPASTGGGKRTSTSGEVLVNGGHARHAYEYAAAAQPSAYAYDAAAAQPNAYEHAAAAQPGAYAYEQAGSGGGSALGGSRAAVEAQMDVSMSTQGAPSASAGVHAAPDGPTSSTSGAPSGDDWRAAAMGADGPRAGGLGATGNGGGAVPPPLSAASGAGEASWASPADRRGISPHGQPYASAMVTPSQLTYTSLPGMPPSHGGLGLGAGLLTPQQKPRGWLGWVMGSGQRGSKRARGSGLQG